MILYRAIPFCFVAFSILPRISPGQTNELNRPVISSANSLVSVHELSIPPKARDSLDKGVVRLRAKDWTGSVSQFQRAIKALPTFYEAWDMLGAAQLAMHQWDEAEAAFRKAIELSHDSYAPPHFGLGLVLCIGRKELPEAESMIEEGLDLDPSDASGHFAMAWVMFAGGRFSEAEESARQAIRYKPTFQEPYLLLGQIHLKQNNYAAVIEDLNIYLKLDSSSSRTEKVKSVLAQAQLAMSKDTGKTLIAQPAH